MSSLVPTEIFSTLGHVEKKIKHKKPVTTGIEIINLARESKNLGGINISDLDRFPEVLSASFYNGSSQNLSEHRNIWGLIKHRQLGCSPRV